MATGGFGGSKIPAGFDVSQTNIGGKQMGEYMSNHNFSHEAKLLNQVRSANKSQHAF